jgi:hypothetical protein
MSENNKNLTCEFAEELVLYLYKEMNGAKKTRFENHLARCPLCTEELAEFSMARSAVQDWRIEEFLPLIPPTIEIPYQIQSKQVENDPVSRSWFDSVRALFTLSPAWTTAATAFAALVVCVGLLLTMSDSLPEDKDVRVQQTKPTNIKTSPSPTTGNENSNPNSSNSKDSDQNQGKSPEPTSAKTEPPAPIKTASGQTLPKTNNTNIKKQVQPKTVNNNTQLKQTNRKAPRLVDDEDEDNTLRLSDLLEEIGMLR